MKSYRLENLDCVNCAMTLEDELNKLDYVKSAKVVFATKNLMIDTDNIAKVAEKIKNIDPDISLLIGKIDKKEQSYNYNVKSELIQLSIYIILFLLSILWTKLYPDKPLVYIGYGVFIIIYLISGWGVISTAFRNILKGKLFDENFLMTFATVSAFIIGAYTESVAVMLFYRAGEFFQSLAVNRSRKAIKSLIEVRPDYARIINNGKELMLSPEEVKVGDIVIVKAGEKIPLDGIIVNGKSSVDQRALTGESIPKGISIGDKVLSGTINLTGVIEMEVTKIFIESSVSKILDLVENAVANKAKTENFITTFARYYTPIVFLVAFSIAIIPPLLDYGTFSQWIYRGLVILVISCPCALVISIPLGYFGGIGGASRKGILIKGANYLEALSNVDTVVFDKTGTLTKGVFQVTDIVPYGNISKDDLLRYGAIAEAHSNHPIALSIKAAYNKDLSDIKFDEYEEIPGHGLRVKYDLVEILVGNDRLLHKYDIPHDLCNVDGGVAHIVINRRYSGYIIISDEIKDDTPMAVKQLRSLGVNNLSILTGDNIYATDPIAKKSGISKYFVDLLPDDKARIFNEIKINSKGKSIFVGDGVNDAPVIALADIGVSLGGVGSDAAIETADVILMNDSLLKLSEAIKVAKKTKKIIWQNIIFALSVKGVFVILGFFGIASMWEAVFGDIGVALIALFNSMRALK